MTIPSSTVVPRRRAAVWIWAIIILYHLLIVTLVAGPVALASLEKATFDLFIAACVGIIVLLLTIGLALFIIPVGSMRHPRAARRPLWIPLLSSATLAMIVFGTLCLASHEYFFGAGNSQNAETALQLIWISLPTVWLIWLVVFRILAMESDCDRWNSRLCQTLLAGSVLELLIAVPMHIAVRRRGDCCGGMATGLGIGVGVVVTIIALGPAVLLLCHRRFVQKYAKPRQNDVIERAE